MSAVVTPAAGGGYRAVCEDEACAKTSSGTAYTLTVNWRTWIGTEARVRSLAADHNRTRHGAK